MSLFSLATAQVTIEVLDKSYHAAMNAVEARWTRLTRMMGSTPALGGLGRAAAGLMHVFGGLAKVVSVIPTAFFAMAKVGVSAFGMIGKAAVPVLGAMAGGIKAVVAAMPALAGVAKAAFVNLKGAASTIGDVLGSVVRSIGKTRVGSAIWKNVLQPTGEVYANIGKSLIANLKGAGSTIGSVVGSWGKAIAGSRLGRGIASAIKAAGPEIHGAMSTIFSATGGIFKGLGRGGMAVGAAIGGVPAAMGAMMGAVGKAASGLWSIFSPVIGRIGSGFKSVLAGVGNVFGGLAKTAVSVLGGAAKTVGGLFSSALGAVGGLAGGALKFGGMALGALGLAGGLTLGAIAQETATAENQFVTLQRVLGGNVEQTEVLNERFKTLASTMGGIPLDEIYKIADVGARLGIAGNELGLFTTDMAKMSTVLAEIPVEEAATRIARLLAVFQKGTKDAGRMASAINALDMASTATGRDILDVSSRLSGTASVLGMRPQQALALSAALRQAGVPIETAGTSITQILGRMASKKDAPQFAKTAGMSLKQWEGVIGTDPLKALVAFEQGLQRFDNISQVRILDKLHMDGQRVRSTLLQLGRVLPQLNQYVQIAEQEWESMSSIQKGAAMVADMLGSKYELLVNNFQLMVRALGAGLMPMFKAGADALIFLLRDLTKFFENKGGVIAEWATKIGDALAIVGVLFRSRARIWEYVVVTMQEKWEQFAEVIKRVSKLAGEWMVWGFRSGISVIMTMFSDLEFFLFDLFEQIGDKLPKILNNMVVNAFNVLPDPVKVALAALNPALAGGLAKMQPMPVEPIRPGFDMFGDPRRNIVKQENARRAAAGQPPMSPEEAARFGMPGGGGGIFKNLPDQQQRLAGIAGGIQQDMQRGVFERRQQMRQMDLQDENARREKAGLPPLTRKQAEQLRRRKLRERTRAAAQPRSVMLATQAAARKQAAIDAINARNRAKKEARDRAMRLKRGRATLGDLGVMVGGGVAQAGRNMDFGNIAMDLGLPEGQQKLGRDIEPAIKALQESINALAASVRQGRLPGVWGD